MKKWQKDLQNALTESYKEFGQFEDEPQELIIGPTGDEEPGDETEETEVVEQAPVEDVIADLINELTTKIELDEEGQPVGEDSIKFADAVDNLECAKSLLVGEETEEEPGDGTEETEETEELGESEETEESTGELDEGSGNVMDQGRAQAILSAIEADDYHALEDLNVSVFGNKGRKWSNTGCITDLDPIKGECNPRLSSNYCDVSDIGCPECLQTLRDLASGSVAQTEETVEDDDLAGEAITETTNELSEFFTALSNITVDDLTEIHGKDDGYTSEKIRSIQHSPLSFVISQDNFMGPLATKFGVSADTLNDARLVAKAIYNVSGDDAGYILTGERDGVKFTDELRSQWDAIKGFGPQVEGTLQAIANLPDETIARVREVAK